MATVRASDELDPMGRGWTGPLGDGAWMEPKSETKVKFLKVNAEAARFRDLLGIYFSTKIKGSKEYIELHPDVNEKILERTSILFASVLVQKLLKLHAKLLALGYKFEELVNILFNENIFTQILINKLQGKLPMLDKESETYVSAIGCLDKRVDLDIKPVDIRYFPVLSAMASKVVYENKKFVEAAIKGQWKLAVLALHNENSILEKLKAVYTFGQPRVGNASFGRHFGNCFLYDSHYVYKVRTKIFNMHAYGLKETTGELYEHYFTISPLALMKRSMDAIGKVWRSLISPNRESLPLLYLRYWGMWLWWAVDHNPQDYINALRLGRKQLDKAD
ncbi:hypothetical protein AgCh_012538 [Apium graveolens]